MYSFVAKYFRLEIVRPFWGIPATPSNCRGILLKMVRHHFSKLMVAEYDVLMAEDQDVIQFPLVDG